MNCLDQMEYKIQIAVSDKPHFHTELEFLFVIEGTLTVGVQDERFALEKHDIMLINSGVQHEIDVPERAIVCVVTYPWKMLSQLLGGEECVFRCNSAAGAKRSYLKLQAIFQQLVYQAVSRQHRTSCVEHSLMYRLLDELIENHLQTTKPSGRQEDLRLHHILRYVGGNFQSNISLSALADEMFVSTSTLSRFFKKKTGIYFADYVNQVRMEYAGRELCLTDKSVTQIAVDSGFSNPSAFNRVFRETYHMTPSDYRRHNRAVRDVGVAEEDKLKARLRDELQFEILANTQHPVCTAVNAKIDLSKGRPYRKSWNQIMNVGSLNNLLMVNMQRQVLYLAEKLGFRYVRVWNIFSKPMMITDGKRMSGFQYDQLDLVLDFLVEHHLVPFFEMGARPSAAVKAEGQTVYFEEEYIEFASRAVWEALVADFVRHITKRYGVRVVREWIFEMSYDIIHAPQNVCYPDRQYQHINAFSYLYRQLKNVSEHIQVGGPGALIEWNQSFTEDFLNQCSARGCVPDFVSFFLFPYETVRDHGHIMHHRTSNRNVEIERVEQMEELLARCAIDRPICISEWNSSLSNRDYLNDSCFRAAYIVEKIGQIGDRVHMLGLWMASDWVSNYYDIAGRLANGGSGLLTKDMVHKPAYYALSFLNAMGDSLVDRGTGYLVTRRRQDYYILCHNFKWYDCSCFVNKEDIDDPARIADLFQDNTPLTLQLELSQLPFSNCAVKKRLISPKEGMILTEWGKFQYARSLDAPDVQYIRQACFPRMYLEQHTAEQHQLRLEVTLQPHEIMLIHVYQAAE